MQDVTENAAYLERPAQVLAPGVQLLRGQYSIDRYLGMGGFGITYLATNSLDRKVVLKECFPGVLSIRDGLTVRPRKTGFEHDYRTIVSMFVREARHLARLSHPNIVAVHQVFEENDTAYIALDLIEGRELLDYANAKDEHCSPQSVVRLLSRLLTTLDYMHGEGMLHRDIAPDNIIVDSQDNPVLIDFGAAVLREKVSERTRTSLLAVKDGYSPPENYLKGAEQTVASDLYSLGATMYHLISGNAPAPSNERMAAVAQGQSDPYVPLSGQYPGYQEMVLGSIDNALRLDANKRYQSARAWSQALPAQISNSSSVLQLLRKRRETTAANAGR
ncbi:serine/threonine-protein kinase [Silicimonas sp. MF1-12-2]|uniref:serine/threonine-protein kinase n=1 Tax=Silicimonas sp. MF1-12-2 TaxID=3384793 RepID=UPI0039B49134